MDRDKIERVYTTYAGFYDHVFGRVFQEGRESAIRNLNVQPGEKVLEVGVGTGIALPMYPNHCHIVGIDLSEGMLAKAKERIKALQLSHVKLYRMDAGAMEFEDNSFDTVVAAYVVTAVPDYRKVVNEMIRVCRPGGAYRHAESFQQRKQGHQCDRAGVVALNQTFGMANGSVAQHGFGRDVVAGRP